MSAMSCRERRDGGRFSPCPNRAEKLKNWKSEKLTSRMATQHSRISGFQDCRFSPALPYPKSCRRMSLDGGGVGNVLNGKFMLKLGLLGSANINNHLTTGVDPNRKYSVSAWMTGTYCSRTFIDRLYSPSRTIKDNLRTADIY